ncbi:unnamed protein product [Amoebophrya sp. A25]|nr:unnamed protein product [Amoebophrya sp. A25]|eukprot:GSA25T00001616001.1
MSAWSGRRYAVIRAVIRRLRLRQLTKTQKKRRLVSLRAAQGRRRALKNKKKIERVEAGKARGRARDATADGSKAVTRSEKSCKSGSRIAPTLHELIAAKKNHQQTSISTRGATTTSGDFFFAPTTRVNRVDQVEEVNGVRTTGRVNSGVVLQEVNGFRTTGGTVDVPRNRGELYFAQKLYGKETFLDLLPPDPATEAAKRHRSAKAAERDSKSTAIFQIPSSRTRIGEVSKLAQEHWKEHVVGKKRRELPTDLKGIATFSAYFNLVINHPKNQKWWERQQRTVRRTLGDRGNEEDPAAGRENENVLERKEKDHSQQCNAASAVRGVEEPRRPKMHTTTGDAPRQQERPPASPRQLPQEVEPIRSTREIMQEGRSKSNRKRYQYLETTTTTKGANNNPINKNYRNFFYTSQSTDKSTAAPATTAPSRSRRFSFVSISSSGISEEQGGSASSSSCSPDVPRKRIEADKRGVCSKDPPVSSTTSILRASTSQMSQKKMTTSTAPPSSAAPSMRGVQLQTSLASRGLLPPRRKVSGAQYG